MSCVKWRVMGPLKQKYQIVYVNTCSPNTKVEAFVSCIQPTIKNSPRLLYLVSQTITRPSLPPETMIADEVTMVVKVNMYSCGLTRLLFVDINRLDTCSMTSQR